MALNWDAGQIKNYDVITTHPLDLDKEDKRWHPVTETLLFMTMAIDMGTIDESNVDEWLFRVRLIQLLDGPNFHDEDDNPIFITREDIANHVGLQTNVSTKHRKHWLARVLSDSEIERHTPKQDKSAFTHFKEWTDEKKKKSAA